MVTVILIFFFCLDMIFFGILNIPLFQYLCEIPTDVWSGSGSGIAQYQSIPNYMNDISNQHEDLLSLSFFQDRRTGFKFCSYPNCLLSYWPFMSFLQQEEFVSSFDSERTTYLEVEFQTSSTSYTFLEFLPLQRSVFVLPDETHLIFFRMYNAVSFPVSGISIYLVYPVEFSIFLQKVQCFCFEEIFLFPFEVVDLPVIFYILGEIQDYLDYLNLNKLFVSYLFLLK